MIQQFLDTLDKALKLLQIKGDNDILVHNIEELFRTCPDLPSEHILKNSIKDDILISLFEDIKTGKDNNFYTSLIEEYPESLLELWDIPDINPEIIKNLRKSLNVTSLYELQGFFLFSPEKIAALPAMPLTTMESMYKYFKKKDEEIPQTFLNLEGRLYEEIVIDFFKEYLGDNWHIHSVGEVRRALPLIKRLEILITSPKMDFPPSYEFCEKLEDSFLNYIFTHQSSMKQLLRFQEGRRPPLERTQSVSKLQNTFIDFILPSSLPLRIWFCQYQTLALELVKKTSSDLHWKKLEPYIYQPDREQACLFPTTEKIEEEFYNSLKMSYIPPEVREGEEEIPLALKGELPEFIKISDIKGDLHIHTCWSDGKNTIEQMIAMAQCLGYEYIGISDHTRAVQIVPGLDVNLIKKQISQIKNLNKSFNGKFTILAGSEVDIMPDGSVYFPDAILKELDIAIASLHLESNCSPKTLYNRMVKVLDNPYIDAIAHPTGRILHVRESYKIDWKEIFKIILQKGKALEINCTSNRFDLPEEFIKLAVKMKIPLLLDTDSHSATGMKMMSLGVSHARRGWACEKDILNTRSLENLKLWVKNRRSKEGIL